MYGNIGYGQGGNDRAYIRTGIEDPRRQCTLFFGKPFCYRLDSSREVTRFAEPQRTSGHTKAEYGIDQRMADGGNAPETRSQRVTDAGTQFIDQPAGRQQA